MDADRERRTRNEALFREVNERIGELPAGLGGSGGFVMPGFLCECADGTCSDTVDVTKAQYEAVRKDPRRFVVLLGHEDLKVDAVVERHELFLVVEKKGDAAELAAELDPRS
jgi:hypothetical protein